jgi:hypothetical protein
MITVKVTVTVTVTVSVTVSATVTVTVTVTVTDSLFKHELPFGRKAHALPPSCPDYYADPVQSSPTRSVA